MSKSIKQVGSKFMVGSEGPFSRKDLATFLASKHQGRGEAQDKLVSQYQAIVDRQFPETKPKKTNIPKDLISALEQGPEAFNKFLAEAAALDAVDSVATVVEPIWQDAKDLGKPGFSLANGPTLVTTTPAEKAAVTRSINKSIGKRAVAKAKSKGTNLAKLAEAREAYFKKMGFGKYAKAKKKTAKQTRQEKVMPKAKKKSTKAVNAQLAAARDAYFRKMKFGKYAPKSKKA